MSEHLARDISDIPAYYDYLVGLGFTFHIFKEEPEYNTFTSYPTKGVILPDGSFYSTARQHFVEMITEGGHGINRPMTDREILEAHPDLTQDEINTMRATYRRNQALRPFKLPIEITGLDFPERERQTIVKYIAEFYTEVLSRKPFIDSPAIPRKIKVNQAYSPNPGSSPINRTSPTPFTNPKPGTFWFDNRNGRLLAYLNDGSGSTLNFWVEVG
jgi:hypothetical protein